ncbi:MAG: hypothetical protein Q7S27_00175 [Nanoarchaeota archaeon]|nr:hypothetical protein [Nanoarchaeota archaeon]
MVRRNEDYDGKGTFPLFEEANEILKREGYDIWGERRSSDSYRQSRFEGSMMSGAFGSNGEKNRRRQSHN